MSESIGAEARGLAQAFNLIVWEGFPVGATLAPPVDTDVEAFLGVARAVGARILYIDPTEDLIGFSVDGVLHVLAGPALTEWISDHLDVRQLTALYAEDDAANRANEDFLERRLAEDDDDDEYTEWGNDQPLPAELRDLVDRIVADQEYEAYQSDNLIARYTRDLDSETARTVSRSAERVFRETVSRELDRQAALMVAELSQDPAHDVLAWDQRDFVAARLGAESDARLGTRLARALREHTESSGSRREAEIDVERVVKSICAVLPPPVQDQLAFTSRVQMRASLLEPYVADVRPEHRRPYVVQGIVERVANDVVTRERRYATAARALMAAGETKAAASRQLGISTNVIDRLFGTHREDVALAADDPLFALAPVLLLTPGITGC